MIADLSGLKIATSAIPADAVSRAEEESAVNYLETGPLCILFDGMNPALMPQYFPNVNSIGRAIAVAESTPAMAAGVTDRVWDLAEVIA